MVICGYKNARDIKIVSHMIKIVKQPKNLKFLNIVMVSDLHLGTTFTLDKLKKSV